MSKSMEYSQLAEDAESVAVRGCEDTTSDVLIDDYKDIEIEILGSTRDRKLWWMGAYD